MYGKRDVSSMTYSRQPTQAGPSLPKGQTPISSDTALVLHPPRASRKTSRRPGEISRLISANCASNCSLSPDWNTVRASFEALADSPSTQCPSAAVPARSYGSSHQTFPSGLLCRPCIVGQRHVEVVERLFRPPDAFATSAFHSALTSTLLIPF